MKKPGDKYRPSNGTEGENFMDYYCYKCRKDDPERGCEINLIAFCTDIESEHYPEEWTYTTEGKPTCTAFHALPTPAEIEEERERKEQARIRAENKRIEEQGQLSMFDLMEES